MNNPITKAILAALSAAYNELSTPEAQAWYKAQAIRLYQFIITVSIATIAFGRTCRIYVNRKFAKQPIGLLSPAQELAEPAQPINPEPTPAINKDDLLTHISTQPTTDSEPLESLTLVQLRSKLDQAGIIYHKKARKSHLINLLLVSA